jgi:leucyl-tRNA synthetase
MEDEGIGRRKVQYRMRDWLISRQRYWGAPIPIVHCPACGTVPVPEDQLPVELPHIDNWAPGDDGRSPLANAPDFVNTICPSCGGPARRETDTMDGFACSSWYFLRFVSPHYEQGPFDPDALAHWGCPDLYVGGAEHATMHLLYARFWTKVMADAGIVPFREPFPTLRSQGMLTIRDPETGQAPKMSKSKGNVVTPDAVAESHGVDALRIYLMFMAPFENTTVWEEEGINGAYRFVGRTWQFVKSIIGAEATPDQDEAAAAGLTRARHRAIKRVSEDIEAFKFNTAIAALMEYLNALTAYQREHGTTVALIGAARDFVLLLAPFAPHISEELWAQWGGPYSIHQQPWSSWDEAMVVEETITLAVQVNGRVRDRMTVPATISEAEAHERALQVEGARRYLNGHTVKRVIYIPGRLVNIVTGQR